MEWLLLIAVIWLLKFYAEYEDKKENKWRNENTTNDLLNELKQKKKKSSKRRTTTPKKPSLDYNSYWDEWEYKAVKAEYMRSYKYQRKRKARLKLDNYQCVVCKHNNTVISEPLEVHHLSYQNLGKEDFKTELVSLCRLHHQLQHNKYGYSYDDEFPLVYE